jgi:hypothetical protein
MKRSQENSLGSRKIKMNSSYIRKYNHIKRPPAATAMLDRLAMISLVV